MTMRPYQLKAVEMAAKAFGAEDRKHPLLALPTGAGKTHVIAGIIEKALGIGIEHVLILSHVKEILRQNRDRIEQTTGRGVSLYSAGLEVKQIDKITVAGIQSAWRAPEAFSQFQVVIIDECFPAGTAISTPSGDIPIECIEAGDIVYSAFGVDVVEATSRKETIELYEVKLSNGRSIECTGNHPFFTEKGWLRASALERGAEIFTPEAVSELRDKHLCGRNDKAELDKNKVLLNILLKEKRELHERSENKKEDVGDTEKDWAQAAYTWRERNGTDSAARENVGTPRGVLGNRACSKDNAILEKWRRLSSSLQNRYCKPKQNDSDRVGWRVSFFKKEKRRQEGCPSEIVRVDDVSVKKQARPIPVFNLQVRGHPSYFAGGVLVHNCHLISTKAESMYQKFLAHMPDATRIGLTATPFRLKEGYIYGPGMMFDHLAYDLTSADNFNRLIEDGYLSDLTVKATAQKLSVEGVKTIGGDFNEKQLSAENDREEVTNACVQEIIAKGADRKKWLVFAIDIQHAQHVSDAMNACGVKTALLHSKMREDRDMLIRRFRDGEYRCLVNINILTTGFDVPDIDLVALLRPTKSPVLHVQTIGRGMRVAVGKSDCLILDFAGNISRLGPINRVHVRKKGKGGKGGVMAKECPQCAELVHLSVKVCPKCEHKFVFREKLTPKADLQEVIARKDRPRWFVVVDVKYRVIEKYNSPPMLMVTYLTAEGDKIREWCCIEHQNFAGVKAKQWMAKRGVDFHYTEEAFAHRGMIPNPKKILVDLSGRYPDIKETIFSRNSVQLALSQEA